ncbi:MAG TPA: lysoplasmalogenase [Caulobacter sp.]|nr:lysoplasmalogenase [Caulobacter sp.]
MSAVEVYAVQPSAAQPLIAALALLSPLGALVYGLVFSHRHPSAPRTSVKVAAVGILALLAAFATLTAGDASLPWAVLALGYALCAIGDAFLAGDPKRWLTPGLVAFLVGHIGFIVLFATAGEAQAFGPGVYLAMAAVALTGAGMLAWLWPDLDSMRWPVAAYVVVIVTMVGVSLPHWGHNIAWPIGALMFMASDAILAGELFKGTRLFRSPRLTAWAIWFLYYGAQLAFLAGTIGYADRY